MFKELHRLPQLAQGKTSAQTRYLTAASLPRSGFVLWVDTIASVVR